MATYLLIATHVVAQRPMRCCCAATYLDIATYLLIVTYAIAQQPIFLSPSQDCIHQRLDGCCLGTSYF